MKYDVSGGGYQAVGIRLPEWQWRLTTVLLDNTQACLCCRLILC